MKVLGVDIFVIIVVTLYYHYILCDTTLGPLNFDDEFGSDTYELSKNAKNLMEAKNAKKNSATTTTAALTTSSEEDTTKVVSESEDVATSSIGTEEANTNTTAEETTTEVDSTTTSEAEKNVTESTTQTLSSTTTTEKSTLEIDTTTTNVVTTNDTNMNATEKLTVTLKPKTNDSALSGRSMSTQQTKHIRKLLRDVNPFRSLLNTDIVWIGSMSDMKLETIAVPAAFFRKAFWVRLSKQTNVPLSKLQEIFAVNFDQVQMVKGNYMVDLMEEKPDGDYINLGTLFNFLIKHNINTEKLLICLGFNTDVFTTVFEDEIILIVNELLDLLKLPFRYGESYIEKLYHEATENAMKTLENYISFSPSNFIDNNVNTLANKATVYADNSALKASEAVESFKEPSSKLVVGAMQALRPVLTLPAAHCSASNPCRRKIDFSSFNELGNTAVERYNSIAPYVTQLYDSSVDASQKASKYLGPVPKAYAELTSKTMYSMTLDESTKMLKAPYVLFFSEGTFMDRVLTLPQLLIEVGGDRYKPMLMIVEPFLRLGRYFYTGDYDGSLSAGVNMSVNIPAKIFGADVPMNIPQPVYEDLTKYARTLDKQPNNGVDKQLQMIQEYTGKPPEGGHKHNLTAKGNHSSIFGKFMNIPSFLRSAGGYLYEPSTSAMEPFIQTMDILFNSNDPYFVKIQNVEKLLDSAPAYVAPLAIVVKGVYPVIDLAIGIFYGEIGLVQIGLKVPTALSSLGTGVYEILFKTPAKIFSSMFGYNKGDNGVVSMAHMQFDPQFNPTNEGIFPPDTPNVVGRSISNNKTSQRSRSGVTNIYEPAAAFVTQLATGFLGDILNPAKVKDSKAINYKYDPITSYTKLMMKLGLMYKLATDEHLFLEIVLGDQKAKNLLNIGIDAKKLLQNDIDPSKFLLGGIMMLPESRRTLFGTVQNPNVQNLKKFGINDTGLAKVKLTYSTFLDDGIMSANEELLRKYNVNPFLFINRIMRGSIMNEAKFRNFGIDWQQFISTGLRPDYLFIGGLPAVEKSILKKHGVNPSSNKNLGAIGISEVKMQSRNISVSNFLESGIETFTDHEVFQKFGVCKKKLVKSIYAGLDNQTVYSIGIDVRKLTKCGYTPLSFIVGISDLMKANDEKLLECGIDKAKLKAAKLNADSLLKYGLTSKMYTQLYRKGIRLQHLTFSMLSTWGLDAMMADTDSPLSVAVSLSITSTKVLAKPGVVGRSLSNAVNVSYFDPSGNYTKMAKNVLKKFTGDEVDQATVVLLFNSYLRGNTNYQKLLNPGNAFRIMAGSEQSKDILNPFNRHKQSTLSELNALYADLPPPSQSSKTTDKPGVLDSSDKSVIPGISDFTSIFNNQKPDKKSDDTRKRKKKGFLGFWG